MPIILQAVITRLRYLEDAIKDELEKEMGGLETDFQKHWADLIPLYFHARQDLGKGSSGQLAASCVVTRTAKRNMSIGMAPIYHVSSHGTYEYGKYIREGFSGSFSGTYNPRLDRKVHMEAPHNKKGMPGYHPGVDKAKFWIPFLTEYQIYVRDRVTEAIERATSRAIRKSKKPKTRYKFKGGV